MERLKRYFPIPLVFLLMISSAYSLFQCWRSDFQLAWLGAAIAVVPMVGFFIYVTVAKTARTKRYQPLQLFAAILGSLLVLLNFALMPALIAMGLGLGGCLLYFFWYTPLDRSRTQLTIGQLMPDARFVSIDGDAINTADCRSQAHVWMFVRGNWCPFCVAQVQELADAYVELSKLGARVMLVAEQDAKDSEKLAKRFNIPITFLVDPDAAGVKALGIDHIGGVPFGLSSQSQDTVMPTVIVTDSEGKVIFADKTDDYRVRPEPEVFVEALRSHAALSA